MSKKYYYAKDVTCPDCKGLGYTKHPDFGYPEHDIDTIESNIELYEGGKCEVYWERQKEEYYADYHCYNCEGKGYVHDEIDEVTGYTIIDINGECE